MRVAMSVHDDPYPITISRGKLRDMERTYTVAEVDALRHVVNNKWLFGSYQGFSSGMSRTYKEAERVACVEEMVRTHMLAGHTAEDLYASERTAA